MHPLKRMARARGSAMTELLVAALGVVILFIAASPFYRAARTEASRLRCQTAIRLLAEAQEQHRTDSPTHAYAESLEELRDILPNLPRCPDGGRFRFRFSTEKDCGHDGRPLGVGRLMIYCTHDGHPVYVAPR